ncbi:MAG: DMT family transporter [Pseudomonadota bacterium]
MNRLVPYILLISMGVGWGATIPLTKIAVSTGYGHFGLIFWQLVIAVVILGSVTLIRRRGLPWNRRVVPFYLIIAFIGTLVPNTASYQAIAVLPSGIISIFLSLIPMLAFPIALGLGLDQFSLRRLAGLTLGLTAVLLIIGVPTALPDPVMLLFIPIGLIAPLMYAFEGNFVARWGTGGAGPIQLLCGSSLLGAVIVLPVAFGAGHWINPIRPWGAAEWALLASSAIHACVYTIYVMAVRRYGSVFSVQVSYLVTLSGMGWAMVLLGETYSGPIWAALILMLFGMYFVRPKEQTMDD